MSTQYNGGTIKKLADNEYVYEKNGSVSKVYSSPKAIKERFPEVKAVESSEDEAKKDDDK